MPIINTLITAKDNMSGVINNLADNVSKAKKKVTDDFGGTSDSVIDLEDAFDSMRNTGVSSFGDIMEIIDKVKSSLSDADSTAQRFALGFTLLAAGVTAVTAALIAGVNAAADYTREMGQIAKSTNSTVEWLQRMKAEFINTGMEIDKFGDINKDVLDHLGDGFRDGSGPADDMKALGLNVKDYNKYLNQADGGTKALIHTFYQLRASGRNMAEITNMMETLASDGSHLASTLNQYASEQEALNAIQAQNAEITQSTIDKYAEWDKNMSKFSTTMNAWRVNSLLPVVDTFNDLIDVLNKDDWTKNDFMEFMFDAANFMKSFGVGAGMVGYSKADFGIADEQQRLDELTQKAKDLQADLKGVNDTRPVTGGWKKTDTGAAARAKAAAAAAERLAAQKSSAADWLAQRDLEIRTDQERVDANYDIQLKKLDAFHKKGLIDEAQYQRGIQILNTAQQQGNNDQIYQRRMEQLNSQHDQMLLSEADYQKKLHEIQAANAGNILDTNQSAALERLNYEHEKKLVSEKEYQEKLLALTQEYNQRRADLNTKTSNIANTDMYDVQAEKMQKFNAGINSGIGLANSFAETIQNVSEQGSAAWIAAIVVQKGMMITQAIMAANLAGVMAAASTPGGPAAQLAAATTVQTWGYAQAAMIAAQGIMEIAGARANGGDVRSGKTYLVGERGPELFTVPSTGGQITSNANLQKAVGGGGNSGGIVNYNQYNTFNNSGMKEEDAEGIKNMTNALIDKKMADANR